MELAQSIVSACTYASVLDSRSCARVVRGTQEISAMIKFGVKNSSRGVSQIKSFTLCFVLQAKDTAMSLYSGQPSNVTMPPAVLV